MIETVSNSFDKFGIVIGILVLVICAVVYLFICIQKQNEKYDAETKAQYEKYETDLRETTKQLELSRVAIERNNEVIERNSKVFEDFQKALFERFSEKVDKE